MPTTAAEPVQRRARTGAGPAARPARRSRQMPRVKYADRLLAQPRHAQRVGERLVAVQRHQRVEVVERVQVEPERELERDPGDHRIGQVRRAESQAAPASAAVDSGPDSVTTMRDQRVPNHMSLVSTNANGMPIMSMNPPRVTLRPYDLTASACADSWIDQRDQVADADGDRARPRPPPPRRTAAGASCADPEAVQAGAITAHNRNTPVRVKNRQPTVRYVAPKNRSSPPIDRRVDSSPRTTPSCAGCCRPACRDRGLDRFFGAAYRTVGWRFFTRTVLAVIATSLLRLLGLRRTPAPVRTWVEAGRPGRSRSRRLPARSGAPRVGPRAGGRRLRREVTRGRFMLMIGMPFTLGDTSDMWFGTRWSRIVVTMSGPL